MKTSELFEKVCREMPEGWSMAINLENGHGGVDLFSDFELENDIDDDELSIEQQVIVRLEYAKDKAANENKHTPPGAQLLEALEELVKINEEHNSAISNITGKPTGWCDDYLNKARTAIRKANDEVLK